MSVRPGQCSRIAGLRSLLPLAVLTAALPALLSAAAGEVFVPGKDDERPPGRGEDYRRQAFPCDDPTQDLLLTAGLALTFADTTSGVGLVAAYSCQPGWPETGPEHLYRLTAAEDLILDAWLTDNVPDHDLILLSACHTDSCLVQANSELSAVLRADRTYYLMVDGYQAAQGGAGAAGPYTLILETRYLGLPALICEPGGAIILDLAEIGDEVIAGNLFEAPNLVSIDDCSPITMPGGEAWYALTMPAAAPGGGQTGFGSHQRVSITVTTGVQTLDLALWLFDGCGPAAVCLAFVDNGNAGQNETIAWENQAAQPATFYLAVDCRRPPTMAVYGGFSLQLNTTVATERRTWTSVRERFR